MYGINLHLFYIQNQEMGTYSGNRGENIITNATLYVGNNYKRENLRKFNIVFKQEHPTSYPSMQIINCSTCTVVLNT